MNNTTSYNISDTSYISAKPSTSLNFFWGGFVLYTISYSLIGNPHVSEKICQLMQLGGLCMVFTASIFLIQFKIANNYLRLIFTFYCIWLFIVILRGIQFDFQSVMYMLLNADYGILLYFVPLIILFPQNLNFYKKIFDIIIILGFFFFICDVLFLRDLIDRSPETQDVIEILARNLALPCGFILLTYKYHSNKRKILALAAMVLALLFSIYKARRGLSITLSSVLIFSFLIYLFSTHQKTLVVYLAVLFICIGFLYANSVYNISNNKLLNYISERGEEDTRTGVELYFYNDMQTKDWIIGRGMMGKYYCPGIAEDASSDYRSLIETGYLQIILKGGLIRLILFLLIAVPAAYLGLFSSKNLLSKASAIWIIIALISLYPATVESFSLQYIIVWLSIAFCYSKKFRDLSDNYIRSYFSGDLMFASN